MVSSAARAHHASSEPTRGMFPTSVWLVAAAFAALTLYAQLRLATPDDAASWWIAGRLVATGHADALYAIDPNDYGLFTGAEWTHEAELIAEHTLVPHPYVHLPAVAYILAPLTMIMSFSVFIALGAVITGVSLTLLAAAAIAMWTDRAPRPGVLVAVTTLVWLSSAAQASITLGQTSPFIYALITLSVALSRRRPWLAGACIAVAAFIKITPVAVVVAMLLFASRRRAGLIATGLLAIAGVVSYLLVPSSVFSAWRETVGWIGAHTLAPHNVAIDALLIMPVRTEAIVGVFDESSPWALPIKLLILVVLAVGALALMGSESTKKFEIIAVVMMLGATSVSSVLWVHYTLMGAVGIIGVVALYRWWWAVAFLLLLLPPFAAGDGELSWDLAPLVVLLGTSLVLFCGAVAKHRPSVAEIGRGLRQECVGR
ncbi:MULTISPECIES: glycosyltransferase family 87 protein [Corynebacterium]|uniref:glycosyltransferase family 87 protein n=1 Tax=Corynebacterium TaxID=1716 RepID=UPI00124EB7D0|nr:MULTISPECIES: glycosyltransferase family 87 protein [Corynebacterium]